MNFKFKSKPFKHQYELFNKIKDSEYHAIFWDMGTGKTKLAIDICRFKYYSAMPIGAGVKKILIDTCSYKYDKSQTILPTLIVTPSITIHNWYNEFEAHSNVAAFVAPVRGARKQREKLLSDTTKRIFIVNIEMFTHYFAILSKMKFDIIIVDESQRIKSPVAKSVKNLLKISPRAKYRYIMSGTPITNSAQDIFSQFLFMDKGKAFGDDYHVFMKRNFDDLNEGFKRKKQYFPDYIIKPEKINEFNSIIASNSSRLKKEECLDLPPKVFVPYELDMEGDIKKAYDEMKTRFLTLFEDDFDSAMTASNAAVQVIRLLQIVSGYCITENNEELCYKNNSKLDLLKELVPDLTYNTKVVIFAVFRQNIRMLQREFAKFNPAIIYGATNNKAEQVNKFRNNDSCRVLIANPHSAGIGVNLVEASYSFYYSRNFNLEDWLQSIDRTHRSGSEIHDKITYGILKYKNSVDELVDEALKGKKNLSNSLIETVRAIIGLHKS